MDDQQNQNTSTNPPQNNPTQPPKTNQFDFSYRPKYLSPPPFTAPDRPAEAKQKTPKPPKYRLPIILASVMTLVSVSSIIFAVTKIVEVNNLQQDGKNLRSELKRKDEIIQRLEDNTNRSIKKPDDVPTFVSTKDYMYFNSWDLKIKIPTSLMDISHNFSHANQLLCFNALQSGMTYTPEFANSFKNPAGVGCLRRVSIKSGSKDANGLSYGDHITTIDDYNFFYVAPAKTFSKDRAELAIENAVIKSVKEMLFNNLFKY